MRGLMKVESGTRFFTSRSIWTAQQNFPAIMDNALRSIAADSSKILIHSYPRTVCDGYALCQSVARYLL